MCVCEVVKLILQFHELLHLITFIKNNVDKQMFKFPEYVKQFEKIRTNII